MSIRIVRRHPRLAQAGTPEQSTHRSLDETTDLLLTAVDAQRRRLMAVWGDPAFPEGWTYLELDENLPRSLWLALLHAAVASDYDGTLAELTQELVVAEIPVSTLVVEFEDCGDGEVGVHLIDPGYDDPVQVGATLVAEFFDRQRWELVALRWLLRELGATPRRIETTLAEMLPRGGASRCR